MRLVKENMALHLCFCVMEVEVKPPGRAKDRTRVLGDVLVHHADKQ